MLDLLASAQNKLRDPILMKWALRRFQHAQSLGQVGRVYITGLNLAPYDLAGILKRNLVLPDGVVLQVHAPRIRHYRAML